MYPERLSLETPQARRAASLIALWCLAICGLTACEDSPSTTPEPKPQVDMNQPAPEDMGTMDQPVDQPDMTTKPIVRTPTFLPSAKARVNFKGGRRLGNDLSRALELPRAELCKELSSYDCVEQVHQITLGGVEPYRLGINDPMPVAPVTAPIAVDRIALQSCDRRAELDLEDPQAALVFKAVAQSSEAEPTKESLGQDVNALYDRLLMRDPSDDERRAIVEFWSVVKARSADPKRDWATLSCFMVATSLEALFY